MADIQKADCMRIPLI